MAMGVDSRVLMLSKQTKTHRKAFIQRLPILACTSGFLGLIAIFTIQHRIGLLGRYEEGSIKRRVRVQANIHIAVCFYHKVLQAYYILCHYLLHVFIEFLSALKIGGNGIPVFSRGTGRYLRWVQSETG